MRERQVFILVIFSMTVLVLSAVSPAVEGQKARAFTGQDLHLTGQRLISYQPSTDEHILVLQGGFSILIGANQFSSDSGVVWLKEKRVEFRGRVRIDYEAKVYLEGSISAEEAKGARTTDLSRTVVEDGQSMVVQFSVGGEVFVTAEEREVTDPRGLELYKRADAVVVPAGPGFVVQPGAIVPEWPTEVIPPKIAAEEVVVIEKPREPGLIERVFAPEKPAEVRAKPEVKFRYPVNIAPVGEVEPKIERTEGPDETDIVTVIGRFYMWQKQDERGGLLELQADNAVVFYSGEDLNLDESQTGVEDVLSKGAVKAVYLAGDVVMTEGRRTIRADEMYYDFQRKKAISINAVMRNFDDERGIPIYVRAAKLRQLAENKFTADNITLTSSEFYLPQISLTASTVIITDTTTIDAQTGQLSDSSYDAQMHDVRLKMGERTIFYWPFIRSNLQRPDIPLKSANIGHNSIWGTSVETRWYLSRLLGLREPEGVDSTLAMDYFGNRGIGSGVEVDYKRDDYYGRILGYIIRDSGEDRLGRHSSRRNLKPEQELRGRFHWLHRHFLPYKWQLTTGVGYASDERFIEGYYRGEFNVGKEETFVYLKRLQDNWALSLLGKGRINDFADELEELPSAEFHLTGQSLFDDRFTLYSDTQISQLRQRIGNEHSTMINEDMFSFVAHRTELDMPISWLLSRASRPVKVVPFLAGTFGYDGRSGFRRTLVDGSYSGEFGENKIWLGEAGVRVFPQPAWSVYPNVKSQLWDLDQLRHIIRPHLTAVYYNESDSVVEQRDTLNVGISQRLQTRRGPADEQRTVDWMRLDMDFIWVNNSGDADTAGPDRFIWNKPIVPLRIFSAPDIFSGDLRSGLHRFEMFGPRRNYFSADYIWRMSDTAAILSDMNFDMQSSVVQQFNIGFSRLCWPNLSYYIGSRYLKRIKVLDEEGSNAFTFAATYILDPRYTLVFSQQFDFDYGENIRSDITLIRRYHRMSYGFTYSADESLDEQSIVFSIWPQGVPEMAIGRRKYVGLGGSAGY